MLASSRWLGLSLFLFAACSGSEDTGTVEEPVLTDEGDDEDEDTPRDAGRPTTRIDAGRQDSGGPAPQPRDASTTPRDSSTPPRDANVTPVDAGPAPNPFAPGDRTPDPKNIPECPKVAPENPIGDCLGVPVYATCSYTTYNCICDWYHWLCI